MVVVSNRHIAESVSSFLPENKPRTKQKKRVLFFSNVFDCILINLVVRNRQNISDQKVWQKVKKKKIKKNSDGFGKG